MNIVRLLCIAKTNALWRIRVNSISQVRETAFRALAIDFANGWNYSLNVRCQRTIKNCLGDDMSVKDIEISIGAFRVHPFIVINGDNSATGTAMFASVNV